MMIIDWRILDLKTLDSLLCAGDLWMSEKIQWVQRLRGIQRPAADISHVAKIVFMLPKMAKFFGVEIDPDNLYVSETTTLNKWCGKSGLQINGFNVWLKNYRGNVFARQYDLIRPAEFDSDVAKYILGRMNDPKAKKYENGIPGLLELLLCEIGIRKAMIETAELHCTEWAAELDKMFKLLAYVISNNRMPPCEWWNEVAIINRLAMFCSKVVKHRKSLLDQNMLIPISEPMRIK